jgi:hypothetical protein
LTFLSYFSLSVFHEFFILLVHVGGFPARSLQPSSVANSTRDEATMGDRRFVQTVYFRLVWTTSSQDRKCGKVFRMKRMGQETLFVDSIIFSFVCQARGIIPLLVSNCTIQMTTFSSRVHRYPLFCPDLCAACVYSDEMTFLEARRISVMSVRGDPVSCCGRSAG